MERTITFMQGICRLKKGDILKMIRLFKSQMIAANNGRNLTIKNDISSTW